MLKKMKPGRKYIIVNINEPYAKQVYEILKKGQIKKGEWPEGDISFEEWKKLTWPSKGKNPIGPDRVQEEISRPTPDIPIQKRGTAKVKVRGIGRV